jgi:hypothetical protein
LAAKSRFAEFKLTGRKITFAFLFMKKPLEKLPTTAANISQ